MKKLFLFLAVASTSMFVSCSDDDSKGDGGGGSTAATSIVLAANVTAVEVGQPVVFTVTDNNAKVVTSTSTILVNNVEITGSTFTPTEAGSFAIKATHKNSKDVVLESNTVTITVTAVPTTAGKYTYNGTVYTLDNMIFQVDGDSTNGVSIFDVPTDNGTVPCTLWMGIAFNGELSGLSTASHYYQYSFYVPAVVDGSGNVTGINYPGEAESIVDGVYAEDNLVPFNLDNVDGGTATITTFTQVDNSPTITKNASTFTAGSTLVISHEYDGLLKGNTATSSGIFYGNLTGAKGVSKSIPTEKVNLSKIKIAKK